MENIQRGFIWKKEYIKIQKSKLWYTEFDVEKLLGYENRVIIGYDNFQCLAIEIFLLRYKEDLLLWKSSKECLIG